MNLAEELDEYFHAYPRDTLLSIRNRSGSIRYVSAEPFPFSSDSSRGRVLNTEQWKQRNYRVLTKTVQIGQEQCDVVIASSLDGVDRVLGSLRSASDCTCAVDCHHGHGGRQLAEPPGAETGSMRLPGPRALSASVVFLNACKSLTRAMNCSVFRKP